jgi:membrane-bound serine protease (ClpP class)
MLFVGAVLLALFVIKGPWGLALVGLAAVVEIGETFFWIRLSRRRRIRAGAETLIGARAEVVSPCKPLGHVRVVGELWRARCEAGAEPGETVRIVGREGLTLLVEPE